MAPLVIESAGQPIIKVKMALLVEVPLSATAILKVNTPEAVGVPEMIPALESESPVGSDPELRVQVYGLVPPAAANCVL